MKNAVSNFTSPFTVDNKEELFCLSFGKPATKDVKADLWKAHGREQQAMKELIEKRLLDKSIIFHEPIKQMNLKTFASKDVAKNAKRSQNKVLQIRAERNIFGQLVLLPVEHNIDLQLTFSYPPGPVSFSIATGGEMPVNTDRGKILHSLEASVEPVAKTL